MRPLISVSDVLDCSRITHSVDGQACRTPLVNEAVLFETDRARDVEGRAASSKQGETSAV